MSKIKEEKQALLKRYEKIYDKEDVLLFNSYMIKSPDEEEREIGKLSNIWSGCHIPYDGKIFHSSEQLLFYINFKQLGTIVGFSEEEVNERIDFLMNTKNGFEVKNCPRTNYFFRNINNKAEKLFGVEQRMKRHWKNTFFIAKMKYKYTSEIRDLLEKYRDKIWCEDSFWGDYFAGVVYDYELKKYRGFNSLGRAYRVIYNNRDLIMGES